jgi:hypothetical protein
MKPTAATQEPNVSYTSEKLAQYTERIRLKASIPIALQTRMLQMIRSYHDKFMKLMKNIKRKNSEVKLDIFRTMQKLDCLMFGNANGYLKNVSVTRIARCLLQSRHLCMIKEL